MTQRQKSAQQRLYCSSRTNLMPKRFASTLPAQSLCWLSSISLLSGGLVFAQEASVDNIVPTIESSQPAKITNSVKKDAVIPEVEPPKVEFSERRTRLKKTLRRENIAESRKPVKIPQHKVENSESTSGEIEFSAVKSHQEREPKSQVSTHIPEKPANNSQETGTRTVGKGKDYNNAYIDPTDYNSGTAKNYQAPDSVVVTERSSGCDRTLSVGQNIAGSACAKASHLADSPHKSIPSWLKKSANSHLANLSPEEVKSDENERELPAANHLSHNSWRNPEISSHRFQKTAERLNRFIPSPSEFTATTTSNNSLATMVGTLPLPMIENNLTPRPSTVSYDFSLASVLPQVSYTGAIAYSGTGMLFPLSVPAPITSLFGWRVHPITGDRRFHAGTDLGAPMGSPVLAAAKGQIESANWMGGYGLAVVINHSSAEQTLYGHMSQIFVHPGQWVEPGTVIGQVGTTGNSTGPHLHFEVRHLTQDGWVAVDPGVKLQTALGQLVQSLRTAQVPREGGS